MHNNRMKLTCRIATSALPFNGSSGGCTGGPKRVESEGQVTRQFTFRFLLSLIGISQAFCMGWCDLYLDLRTGEIVRIGWDDNVIVVQRDPAVGDGPLDWMIINVKDHTITGPLQDKEWKDRSCPTG